MEFYKERERHTHTHREEEDKGWMINWVTERGPIFKRLRWVASDPGKPSLLVKRRAQCFMILGLSFLSQVLFHDTHLLSSLSCVYYGHGRDTDAQILSNLIHNFPFSLSLSLCIWMCMHARSMHVADEGLTRKIPEVKTVNSLPFIDAFP